MKEILKAEQPVVLYPLAGCPKGIVTFVDDAENEAWVEKEDGEHIIVPLGYATRIYTDAELRYAATERCHCGAGMAYQIASIDVMGAWRCSNILTGRATPDNTTTHTRELPFSMVSVISEDEHRANGKTTRGKHTT